MSGWPILYRGSVKEVCGPQAVTHSGAQKQAVLFRFTDAFSVFDWGKMPDSIPNKGRSLARMGATLFEAIESKEQWQRFSKSTEALELRKGMSQLPGSASAFNEMGERLQQYGLRSHYLGVLSQGKVLPLSEIQPDQAMDGLVVQQVEVQKPKAASMLGQLLYQYPPPLASARLVPLEVVFRFACPPGSSLIERAKSAPESLLKSGIGKSLMESLLKSLVSGEPLRWGCPVVECFTKLEATDRPLPLTEALVISGLTADMFQELILKTYWVAGFLKWKFGALGFDLADGKIEWGMDGEGKLQLVDSIGPDELRLLKDGEQHSKESLRQFYRGTSWFDALAEAKKRAAAKGENDWKRLVAVQPPALPKELRDKVSQMYADMARGLEQLRD